MPISTATWQLMVQPWPGHGEPLARRLAVLGGIGPGQDVLCVGGTGRFPVWAAERMGAQVEVVDVDPEILAQGEALAASLPPGRRPRFQLVRPGELPHETTVFGTAVVDFTTLVVPRPATLLQEVGRVLRPYGTLLVLAPVWHQTPRPEFRELLRRRLGLEAHLLVEWKRWVRAAGMVEITVEDVADGGWATPSRATAAVRGWRLAGLRGVRAVLSPAATIFWQEIEARRLGLAVFRGARWPEAPAPTATPT